VHLVEPAGRKPLIPLLIQDEPGVDNSVPAIDRGGDLLGAGHLRDPVRMNKACGLDTRETGFGQPVDELGPNARLEKRALVLEPVARPHVADGDAHARERTAPVT
jgi:hypothetical protein